MKVSKKQATGKNEDSPQKNTVPIVKGSTLRIEVSTLKTQETLQKRIKKCHLKSVRKCFMGNSQPKCKPEPNKNQVHFGLILGSLGCFFLLGATYIL